MWNRVPTCIFLLRFFQRLQQEIKQEETSKIKKINAAENNEERREEEGKLGQISSYIFCVFMTRVANEAKLPPVCCEAMDFSLRAAKISEPMG